MFEPKDMGQKMWEDEEMWNCRNTRDYAFVCIKMCLDRSNFKEAQRVSRTSIREEDDAENWGRIYSCFFKGGNQHWATEKRLLGNLESDRSLKSCIHCNRVCVGQSVVK